MISVFGSALGPEELEQVRACLGAQWMGMGPKVEEFERSFAERLGLPGLVMTDSGSNALYLALRLLDLPRDSEVILPSFTWVACAHAVILVGCVPVFCDVDLRTHNATAETIAPHVNERTSAIIVVHYAGKPVPMDDVLALGPPVVEDAAHAVDSRRNGSACGGVGDVGIYSFDAVKNLASPEGGAVTARDAERLDRARRMRYCGVGKSGFEATRSGGRWWEYDIRDVAPKMLPNDVSAGIALAQLAKLDAHQARRKAIWDRYQVELDGVAGLTRPADPGANERHSYFTYSIRVAGGGRDALARSLLEQGIYTTLRYHPLHLNPIFESRASLPVTERLNEEALSLPLHPRLDDDDVGRVIEAVRSHR